MRRNAEETTVIDRRDRLSAKPPARRLLSLAAQLRRNFFPIHIERMGGCDVERDVLYELAELLVLRHEIRFAIHFHQDTNLPLQMNVGSNDAFLGRTRRFLARAGDSFGA